MKHFFIALSICVIAVSLTACNDKGEVIEPSSTDTSQTAATSPAAENEASTVVEDESEAEVEPNAKEEEPETPVVEKSTKKPASDSVQNSPLNLDDFRSAIDDVVQDSFQAEVEKTVEGEVSKETGE